MESGKLSLLLIIPLAMLVVAPIAVHADGNRYFIEVDCASQPRSFQFADASVVFLGHHIYAICPPNSGSQDVSFSFFSSASGVVVAQALAGGLFVHTVSNFSPSSCHIYHFVENDEHSFASYDIYTSSCEP